MRKVLVSAAAAVSALAFAAPAAAQYYPAPQGQAYGYNNYGQFRSLQTRVDRLEWQINRLDRANAISDRSADRLRAEANNVEGRLHYAARNGLNPYEANEINARLGQLEQRIRYAGGNRWNGYNQYGYNNYNNYNGSAYNNDRYEREHERWHEDHDDDSDD